MNFPELLLAKLPTHLQHQLCYPDFVHQFPSNLNEAQTITAQCKGRDILLFYPYHAMDPFLKLLKESANDPHVLSIQITIYRLSQNSKVAAYLCQAAENGKEVTILIELKARFDENNNIRWAEKLEEAGCHIIYGFENFKVHSKICLITRRDHNTINYITNVSTGNYNEKTAKQYTDLSLITANQDIGRDAVVFFQNMLLSNLEGTYQHLLAAPFGFKNDIIALIDEEIEKARNGHPASIIMKLNAMTEKDILNKLSEASHRQG